MNRLKVNQKEAIIALHERGWSKRRIARELGLDRVTVRRYIAAAAKSPTPQIGSQQAEDRKSPTVQTGVVYETPESKSSGVQPGCQASASAPWQEQIEQGFKAGFSIQRIYEDLVSEHGFNGSYHSVRRFVHRLHPEEAQLPFRRMECQPAEELQIDFGQGAWIIADGRDAKRICFDVSWAVRARATVRWSGAKQPSCLFGAWRMHSALFRRSDGHGRHR
jgi:predicted transcriptional regulator